MPVLQLRFLHSLPWAGAWLAALAAALAVGWRALARPANVLAAELEEWQRKEKQAKA